MAEAKYKAETKAEVEAEKENSLPSIFVSALYLASASA